ncbi:MAG: urease accessory protein UreF, partial [Bacteroidales bacterium]|nr:urease accessory protein UreF [Bacteroidales bacterium]
MSTPTDSIGAISRLLQFTDSTFPVGTFSFSNGLETAAYENIVTDAASLEEFAKSQSIQAAYSDGVAAIHAFRAFNKGDYDSIVEADKMLLLFKMNDEARLMLKRMGKKLAELSSKLFDSDIVMRWLEDIKTDKTPGTYPVAQGIAYAAAGISERDMFAAHQYGVVNMVLSAALRCVKVSHYDTQKMLFNLSNRVGEVYDEASQMQLKDMNAFFPELDILASL